MAAITVHDELSTIAALRGGRSIARYGDGELDLAYELREEVFENRGPELSRRMREVLESSQKGLLIGVPDIFSSHAQARLGNPVFWDRYRPLFEKRLPGHREFHSAFISRPDNITNVPGSTVRREKNAAAVSAEFWEELRSIWERKKTAIVHFDTSLVKHPLYQNASDPIAIPCAQRNAWGNGGDRYRTLLQSCLDRSDDVELFLISAGPVACVLASDLCAAGCHAIDIGQAPRIYNQWSGQPDMHLY